MRYFITPFSIFVIRMGIFDININNSIATKYNKYCLCFVFFPVCCLRQSKRDVQFQLQAVFERRGPRSSDKARLRADLLHRGGLQPRDQRHRPCPEEAALVREFRERDHDAAGDSDPVEHPLSGGRQRPTRLRAQNGALHVCPSNRAPLLSRFLHFPVRQSAPVAILQATTGPEGCKFAWPAARWLHVHHPG